MAKDKYKLDIGFDNELDRELAKLDGLSFGEPIKPKNKRQAVYQSFKDVGKGAKSAFAPNSHNIERLIKASMPLTLTSEYMGVEKGFRQLKEDVGKQLTQTKQLSRDALKAVKSLFPEDSKLSKLLGRLESKLSDQMSPQQAAELRDDLEAAGIQQELQNNFTKDATLQLIQQNMETKRHNSVIGVLSAINDSTTVLKNFSIHVTNSYYRKSLELQYKTLFTMKENVAATKALAGQLKIQLENIVKNTAMPEAVKNIQTDYLSTSIRSSIADRTKKSLYDMMGGTKLDTLFKNMSRRLSMSIENFGLGLSTLIQGTEGLQMMKGFEEFGQTKSYLAGEMIGGVFRDLIGRNIGERLAATKTGRSFVFNAKNIAADPAGAALQLLDSRYAAGKNKRFDQRMINSLLSYVGRMGESGNQYLGSIYNVSDPNKLGAAFDHKTQTSIVKIIPDLLSKIYSEIKTQRVGGEATDHEVVWDYNRAKLVNRGKFKENIVTDYRRLAQMKVSNPLALLINALSKYTKLDKTEKGELATAIISYLISPRATTNLWGLETPGFLDLLPPNIREKVFKGVKRLIADCKDDAWNTSSYIHAMQNIRNSIPSLQTQLDDLVSIGEADTARSLSLLTRNREDNTFVVDRDNVLKFISKNYGGYEEKWENQGWAKDGIKQAGLGKKNNRFSKLQLAAEKQRRKFVKKLNKGIDASKELAKGIKKPKIELSALKETFLESPEYLSGMVPDFNTWIQTEAYDQFFDIKDDLIAEVKKKSKKAKTEAQNLAKKAEKQKKQAIKSLQKKTNQVTQANKGGIVDQRLNNIQATIAVATQKGSETITAATQSALATDAVQQIADKVKKKPKIKWSDLTAQFYNSYEYAQGHVTDVMTWAAQTGITKNFDIVNDYVTDLKIMSKHKEESLRDSFSIKNKLAKAKEKLWESIQKDDPLTQMSQEDRLAYLRDEMMKSEAFQQGYITDFGEYCLAQGRDPGTGLMSKWGLIKNSFKKGGTLSLGSILRFTRKVDRKVAGFMLKAPFKLLKIGAKALAFPFSKKGRSAAWKMTKFGAAAVGDIATQPFIQMYNYMREARGLDPVFDGGFLGGGTLKGTRKADRTLVKGAIVGAKSVSGKLRSAITTGVSKIWGFLFKPRVSMADEAAKRNLSEDTQVIAAGLDRIANNLEASAEKDNRQQRKERAGNWLQRLGLFGKKKGESKESTTKSKGILGWLKEHKTGLTIAGGFLLIGGLLKGLGVTFDDVKNIASGIWTGIKGLVGAVKWVASGIGSIIDTIGGWLPSWLGGNKKKKVPVVDANGNPVIDPETGEQMYKDGEIEGSFSRNAKTAASVAAGAGGLALVSSTARRALGGIVNAGKNFLKFGWNAGTKIGDKLMGGALTKAAEKKAADKVSRALAKEAAEAVARQNASKFVGSAIEGMKSKSTIIAKMMEAAKGFLTSMVAKVDLMWNTVKSKLKHLGKLATSPKLLKSSVGAVIKKGAAKLGLMIAGAASGIGGILTVGLALWEIGWILWYMWKDDLPFWSAVSKQLLGADFFDPKELEKHGIDAKEMDQIIDSAASSDDGTATLYETKKENADGTFTKTRYYIKLKNHDRLFEAQAKKILADPMTAAEREQYSDLAKSIVSGNVSPEEKKHVIQEIVKGKNVKIAGINFGLNNEAISPGLLNKGKADFKSYPKEMKERVMSFAWDVLEKTGGSLKLNGPGSGMRSLEMQRRIAETNPGAATSPDAPHIRGYGIDLHHTNAAIGSNLAAIPGVQQLLEQNNLKLPLLNWLSIKGKGLNEPWHIEPAEARPGQSTMGTRNSFERDMTWVNKFTKDAGQGTGLPTLGDPDDAAGDSTLEKLNKKIINGGTSTATGGLSIPDGRSTTDVISGSKSSWGDSAAFKNASKAADDTIGKYEGIGDWDSSDLIRTKSPIKPTIFQTSMITTLQEQLTTQKQMAALLHEIVKNTATGFGGSRAAVDPKSGMPMTTSGDFINDPNLVTMHNLKI